MLTLCFKRRLDDANSYSDAQGVSISAADFGSTSSVEPSFGVFVDYFLQRGYTQDINIRAAPYDWRLATGIITLSSCGIMHQIDDSNLNFVSNSASKLMTVHIIHTINIICIPVHTILNFTQSSFVREATMLTWKSLLKKCIGKMTIPK